MNIVEQAARIIDEGAFTEWVKAPDGWKDVHEAKQRYQRSKAIYQATLILKLALACPDLAKELVDDEIARWKDLGIPVDDPALQETIRAKYALKGAN